MDDRERDKGSTMKEDTDAAAAAASKKRRLKREHPPSESSGDYLLPTAPPLASGMSQSYDSRNERKGAILQRAPYGIEDQIPRMHTKEAAGKIGRRDNEPYPWKLPDLCIFFASKWNLAFPDCASEENKFQILPGMA